MVAIEPTRSHFERGGERTTARTELFRGMIEAVVNRIRVLPRPVLHHPDLTLTVERFNDIRDVFTNFIILSFWFSDQMTSMELAFTLMTSHHFAAVMQVSEYHPETIGVHPLVIILPSRSDHGDGRQIKSRQHE